MSGAAAAGGSLPPLPLLLLLLSSSALSSCCAGLRCGSAARGTTRCVTGGAQVVLWVYASPIYTHIYVPVRVCMPVYTRCVRTRVCTRICVHAWALSHPPVPTPVAPTTSYWGARAHPASLLPCWLRAVGRCRARPQRVARCEVAALLMWHGLFVGYSGCARSWHRPRGAECVPRCPG